MSFDLWAAFVAASILITVLPGPSMLLVIAHALAEGPKKSLATVVGVVVADACLIVLALAGVGAVIYSSAIAFTTMKWLGAAYLLYLGLRQWRAALPRKHWSESENDSVAIPRKHNGGFIVGFVTTMLNPKIIGFFIAFFPQFVVSDASWVGQLMILGATFLMIVFAIMAVYGLLAGQARVWIRKPTVNRALQRISGATLIGAAIATATLKRA